MNLSELIEQLSIIRDLLEPHGVEPEVMLRTGDDLTSATAVDYDRFAADEPYVVLIEKAGDPGHGDGIVAMDRGGLVVTRAVKKEVPVLYLDIDGTVRHGKDELGRFVNSADDVVVFPEAVEMMRRWRAAGGRIVGVSNQGGIALGHLSEEDCRLALEATAERSEGLFDAIVACSHHPQATDPVKARCWCRKPSPGLLIMAARDLRECYPDETYPVHVGLMVGDRSEDEECARLAGLDFQWAVDWRAQAALRDLL